MVLAVLLSSILGFAHTVLPPCLADPLGIGLVFWLIGGLVAYSYLAFKMPGTSSSGLVAGSERHYALLDQFWDSATVGWRYFHGLPDKQHRKDLANT
jgi:hypothetical protein